MKLGRHANVLFNLLTTFTGRISRKSWWIGALVIFVADNAGILALNLAFFDLTSETETPLGLPERVWCMMTTIPFTAITVKRFNDRDWPIWLGYVVGGLTLLRDVVVYLIEARHISLVIPNLVTATEGEMEVLMAKAVAIAVVGAVSIVFGLFAFIGNGFLPGTPGPNRHGLNPLESKEALA